MTNVGNEVIKIILNLILFEYLVTLIRFGYDLLEYIIKELSNFMN
jgi:hypothetical protein